MAHIDTPPQHYTILSIVAHPDDSEMHHAGLLTTAREGHVLVATRGEQSTLNYTDQLVTTEQLPKLRRHESTQAMAHLGLQAVYDDFPDGNVRSPRHHRRLVQTIINQANTTGATALATLGCDGFCGHTDHIATHVAALEAQQSIYDTHGEYLPLFSLNEQHAGRIKVPVDTQSKLTALALHRTQFGFLTPHSPNLPETHARYLPLLSLETYDVLYPRTLAA